MRSDPIDPQRLKNLRDALGYTQVELAVKLGVSPGSIHRWENGKQGPIKPYLEKIEALERQVERSKRMAAA